MWSFEPEHVLEHDYRLGAEHDGEPLHEPVERAFRYLPCERREREPQQADAVTAHDARLRTDGPGALAPLARQVPKRAFDRLVQGLAIVFGTETMVVLKDMFALEGPQVAQVAEWVARSLVRATIAEEAAGTAAARTRRPRRRAGRVA